MPPSRPPSSPRALPVLPLAAASLVLLGAALVAHWWWLSQQPTVGPAAAESNPFHALVVLQRHSEAKSMVERTPRLITLPNTPALQVLGNPNGRVTLTLLIDPAAQASRAALAEWLRQATPETRVELRFVPASNRLTGGIAWYLAWRFGKAGPFWQALQNRSQDLEETELLQILGELGIAYGDLRDALSSPDSPALFTSQASARWADSAGIRAPLALIDNLLVDGEVLQPPLLKTYLARRARNEPLTQLDDYLLMRK